MRLYFIHWRLTFHTSTKCGKVYKVVMAKNCSSRCCNCGEVANATLLYFIHWRLTFHTSTKCGKVYKVVMAKNCSSRCCNCGEVANATLLYSLATNFSHLVASLATKIFLFIE